MLLIMAALALPQDAVAQDRGERRRARDAEKELVREIERGAYVKSNVGSMIVLPTTSRSAGAYPGVVAVSLSVGGEFVDQERFSASFEGTFNQTLLQGPDSEDLEFENSLTQGDVHILMGLGVFEASFYPTRRLGIGVRAGGGMSVMPLLVPQLPDGFNPGEETPPPAHQGPLVTVVGGATLEYYTKLSHFSLGADVDFVYILDFNPGIVPSGYLKYTF